MVGLADFAGAGAGSGHAADGRALREPGWNTELFVLVHSVLWPLSLNAYTGFITVPPILVRVGQNFA
jgi:hypothetical protein